MLAGCASLVVSFANAVVVDTIALTSVQEVSLAASGAQTLIVHASFSRLDTLDSLGRQVVSGIASLTHIPIIVDTVFNVSCTVSHLGWSVASNTFLAVGTSQDGAVRNHTVVLFLYKWLETVDAAIDCIVRTSVDDAFLIEQSEAWHTSGTPSLFVNTAFLPQLTVRSEQVELLKTLDAAHTIILLASLDDALSL